jgi:hypothetical protein
LAASVKRQAQKLEPCSNGQWNYIQPKLLNAHLAL